MRPTHLSLTPKRDLVISARKFAETASAADYTEIELGLLAEELPERALTMCCFLTTTESERGTAIVDRFKVAVEAKDEREFQGTNFNRRTLLNSIAIEDWRNYSQRILKKAPPAREKQLSRK